MYQINGGGRESRANHTNRGRSHPVFVQLRGRSLPLCVIFADSISSFFAKICEILLIWNVSETNLPVTMTYSDEEEIGVFPVRLVKVLFAPSRKKNFFEKTNRGTVLARLEPLGLYCFKGPRIWGYNREWGSNQNGALLFHSVH